MPALMAVMKSVEPSKRPIVLGIKYLLAKIVVHIPVPILLGRLIDSTCVFQNDACGLKGACSEYSVQTLHNYLFGSAFVFKLLAVFFMALGGQLVSGNSC